MPLRELTRRLGFSLDDGSALRSRCASPFALHGINATALALLHATPATRTIVPRCLLGLGHESGSEFLFTNKGRVGSWIVAAEARDASRPVLCFVEAIVLGYMVPHTAARGLGSDVFGEREELPYLHPSFCMIWAISVLDKGDIPHWLPSRSLKLLAFFKGFLGRSAESHHSSMIGFCVSDDEMCVMSRLAACRSSSPP